MVSCPLFNVDEENNGTGGGDGDSNELQRATSGNGIEEGVEINLDSETTEPLLSRASPSYRGKTARGGLSRSKSRRSSRNLVGASRRNSGFTSPRTQTRRTSTRLLEIPTSPTTPTNYKTKNSALALLGNELKNGMKVGDHSYRFQTYSECFSGKHAVDYMLENEMASTREDAVELGEQFMAELHLFHHIGHDHKFQDDSHLLYRFSKATTTTPRTRTLLASTSASSMHTSNRRVAVVTFITQDEEDQGDMQAVDTVERNIHEIKQVHLSDVEQGMKQSISTKKKTSSVILIDQELPQPKAPVSITAMIQKRKQQVIKFLSKHTGLKLIQVVCATYIAICTFGNAPLLKTPRNPTSGWIVDPTSAERTDIGIVQVETYFGNIIERPIVATSTLQLILLGITRCSAYLMYPGK